MTFTIFFCNDMLKNMFMIQNQKTLISADSLFKKDTGKRRGQSISNLKHLFWYLRIALRKALQSFWSSLFTGLDKYQPSVIYIKKVLQNSGYFSKLIFDPSRFAGFLLLFSKKNGSHKVDLNGYC